MTQPSYALPPAIQSWRAALELFPEDLQETLGGWLPRIARLVGAASRYQQQNNGEPDGFSGIAQRGPYERLLMSEWALADVYPDEFMRRAAMNEQSFYELAYQEPGVSKRVCVLFDAGSEQLGGPRLVQLALLIILEARAALAKVKLEWGVLQERTLHEGLNRASISAFLESRSARQPGPGDFEAWQEILAEDELDEFWAIGGGRAVALARSHPGASLVHLEDPLDAEASSVNIRLVHGPGAGTSLLVTMPPAAEAVRLVRDPFGERLATALTHSVVLSRTPRLAFSKQRHRLLALTDAGGLVAFHVPGAAGCAPGRPKHVKPLAGETIVAAQVRGRSLSTISVCEQSNELVARGVFGSRNVEPRRFAPCVETDEGAVAFVAPRDSDPLSTIDYDFKIDGPGGGNRFPVVVDADGNLFCWSKAAPTRQQECIATKVHALWPEQACYARQVTPEMVIVYRHTRSGGEPEFKNSAVLSDVIAIKASGDGTRLRAACNVLTSEVTLVEQETGGDPNISTGNPAGNRRVEIALEAGDRVQGVAEYDGQVGIVILSVASQQVYFAVPEAKILLFRLKGEALATVLSPTGSHFAALSTDGHLQVYSFEREAIVLSDRVGVAP